MGSALCQKVPRPRISELCASQMEMHMFSSTIQGTAPAARKLSRLQMLDSWPRRVSASVQSSVPASRLTAAHLLAPILLSWQSPSAISPRWLLQLLPAIWWTHLVLLGLSLYLHQQMKGLNLFQLAPLILL